MTTMTTRPTHGRATTIETDDAARQLAHRVINPQRRHPLVVITEDRSGRSSFDADDIAAQLRATADVFVVDDANTWELNQPLGRHRVYGDAAAVYPPVAGSGLHHQYFTARSGHTDAAVVRAARHAGTAPALRVKPLVTGRMAELEAQLGARQIEIENLLETIRAGDRQRADLVKRVDDLRSSLRHAHRTTEVRVDTPDRTPCGFTDPEDQLRWDIQRTWVETTRPEEKDRWPLPDDYRVGPDFCRTLDTMEGVSRDRVLRTIVRLLVGRTVTDDHPLRSDRSGNAPVIRRDVDGRAWTCRRAPLQQNSPSARRLSYWRSPSGQIQLSRVAVHDDLTP